MAAIYREYIKGVWGATEANEIKKKKWKLLLPMSQIIFYIIFEARLIFFTLKSYKFQKIKNGSLLAQQKPSKLKRKTNKVFNESHQILYCF